MIFGSSFLTNLGNITILEKDGNITHLFIEKVPISYQEKKTKVIKEAQKQILEYLNGRRKEFLLPIKPSGSPFMQEVWNELQKIPYGTTWTYQEVGIRIHRSKAVRAIGLANHKNPIPIIIPCHRVIGKNGKLTGYTFGLEKKEWLLELEKRNS